MTTPLFTLLLCLVALLSSVFLAEASFVAAAPVPPATPVLVPAHEHVSAPASSLVEVAVAAAAATVTAEGSAAAAAAAAAAPVPAALAPAPAPLLAAVLPSEVPTVPTAATAYTAEQLHAYIARGTPEQQRLAGAELARLGFDQLVSSAAHTDDMVRYEAVNALGTLGDARALPLLLRAAVSDTFLYARHRAIWALGTLAARDPARARAVMASLAELHQSRTAPAGERWRAVLALGLLGDAGMGHHITTVLAHTEDETTAWEGLNALATTPCNATASLPVIYPYLTHSVSRVAEAAVRALAKAAETHNVSLHTEAVSKGETAIPESEIGRLARRALYAASKVHTCPQVARRARSLGEAIKAKQAQLHAERASRFADKVKEHAASFNLKSEL
jgi:HEAT repeat protein